MKQHTIGILGEGQLGKMLAMKAITMGYTVIVFGNQQEGVAYSVCHKKYISLDADGGYKNKTLLEQFGRECDVVLLEFENIPTETLDYLSQFTIVCPNSKVLEITQDRWLEKTTCQSLGIKTANTLNIENISNIENASNINFPGILKTRRLGYDGHGQVKINSKDELVSAWNNFKNVPCVYEEFVSFICELSVIVGRNKEGTVSMLPIVENQHENGILRKTFYPSFTLAGLSTEKQKLVLQKVQKVATDLITKLDVVGLLTIEMFLTKDLDIIVNEMAPRPHNSGHFSMDVCDVDQYELYIRASCNLPMITPRAFANACMTNILGDEINSIEYIKSNQRIYLYGKKEIKPFRKMGHSTEIFPIDITS